MMIVRAAKDLDSGAELTLAYQFPTGIAAESKHNLRSWGFACTCAVCSEARLIPSPDKAIRQHVYSVLETCLTAGTVPIPEIRTTNVTNIQKLITILKDTYPRPASKMPRLLIWQTQLFLVNVYSE
jgi:hypothetical protein